MKKVILSLVAMAFSGGVFAQTHSALAGNTPTVAGTGYTFEFNGTDANNCKAGGGIAYYAGVTNQTWAVDEAGKLVVSVPVMATYDDTRQLAKFYSGDCTAAAIDLSSTANQKLSISLNSDDDGEMVVVIYSGSQSNYNATGLNVFDVAIGANTFSVSSLDLAGITDNTNITGIGFFFRGPTGWNDKDFTGDVRIDNIKIGDAVTTSGTTAEINNSLVSVYPNPAKDQITLDLSSVNVGDATVKILNANGMVVYEAKASNASELINTSSFNKGMYMVQVTSGNKVSNKKLVIE